MSKWLRYFLIPFSWLYGLGVWVRHFLYDRGALTWIQYNKAIIGVGNLAVGGAGKTPMIEYLIRFLSDKYRITTLSRGYGRKSKGVREIELTDPVIVAGDEPLQFKRKYPHITVTVSEDRVKGVECFYERTDVFLLDDSFQHRALKPGLNLLLFDYGSLQRPKLLLPAGNFRDLFSQRKRAQGLIITKTPKGVGVQEKKRLTELLAPTQDQWLLFSHLKYGTPYEIRNQNSSDSFERAEKILLVTGIANPQPIYDYLSELGKEVTMMSFPDHHNYTLADLRKIESGYREIIGGSPIVVSTEKDEQRLNESRFAEFFQKIPFYILPVEMEFEENDRLFFEKKILQYCSRYEY